MREVASTLPAPVHLHQLVAQALEEAEVEEYFVASHQRLVVIGPISFHESVSNTLKERLIDLPLTFKQKKNRATKQVFQKFLIVGTSDN